jgi:hypothetical protein
MPVTISKTKSGKYRVSTPHGVKSRHTTKANADAQKRLLNAVDHGWKPTHTESLAYRLVDLLLERDDIHKIGLSPQAIAYARRTSASMSRQPQQWANVQMSILNKGVPRKGFTNMDEHPAKVPTSMK